jgi:hypothetical protein
LIVFTLAIARPFTVFAFAFAKPLNVLTLLAGGVEPATLLPKNILNNPIVFYAEVVGIDIAKSAHSFGLV